MAAKPPADRISHRLEAGRSAADRLKEALAVLTRGDTGSDRPEAVTVAALCRLAAVSRNSLYRYHPGILQSLREHQQRRSACGGQTDHTTPQLRIENTSLREQITKLAALVDHYYAAYRETRVLLERRDRELAELRRSLTSKPLVLGS